jgi:quinol monooxygenase YgiN
MSEPLVVIDRSRIREGKLEDLKTAVKDLAEIVAANGARPIAYDVYFDPGGTRMTVLQVHPDSASMEEHRRIAAAFPGFADMLVLESMEVFGTPSPSLYDLLGQKIELLGDATIVVHHRHAGFVRSGAD